jgi:hypothetical protein
MVDIFGDIPVAGLDHDFGDFFHTPGVFFGVVDIVFEDAAFASLATVFDLVEGVQQEAQFAGAVDVLLVQVGVGGLDAGDCVNERVGGE